jgi:hypothetical protein
MAISINQASQIKVPDWLGVYGTARRRGTSFFIKLEQTPCLKNVFLKQN